MQHIIKFNGDVMAEKMCYDGWHKSCLRVVWGWCEDCVMVACGRIRDYDDDGYFGMFYIVTIKCWCVGGKDVLW